MRREIAAIEQALNHLDDQFDSAVNFLVGCQGNAIVSGVGKSGLIGQKLSATLASTGTPSLFMHATEAMHGDLGRVSRGDVVVLLSNSGTTEEVISLAAVLRQDDVPLIGITASRENHLGRICDAVLCIGPTTEACPYNLAPTASTAAMLALSDALALCVSQSRSFSADDFHRRHPGGSIGKRMLPIHSVLRFQVGKNTAVVNRHTSLRESLKIAEAYPRRCGAVLIVDDHQKLCGIITDGDLRRLLVSDGASVMERTVEDLMTAKPIRVSANDLVKDALQLIREHRLDEIPVIDDNGQPIGVIDVQDLVSLKIIDD